MKQINVPVSVLALIGFMATLGTLLAFELSGARSPPEGVSEAALMLAGGVIGTATRNS